MLRHRFTSILLGCFAAVNVCAQTFTDYFQNKTLRVDYIFSGDAKHQSIYVDELVRLPSWAGRRHHLSEAPLEGNGQIVMRDLATRKVIYKTSFSSLFQEWITTDEAKTTSKGFENTYLLPYPKQPAEIEISLMNPYRKVTASLKHVVRPDDILIHERGTSHVTPHKYMLKSGDESLCIDVAILAEGYTPAEMDRFYQDAQEACNNLFFYEPFKLLKGKFNVVAVASPSQDSGVSVPRNNDWKHTAFSSHFDTFYSDRYLTTTNVQDIHNALAGIPYEHIIILANTETYGGGGIYNSYLLTMAHHELTKPVLVHEFGHSFAGLADEYFYDDDVPTAVFPLNIEPWEQNITTRINFASKWQDMLTPGTPVPTSPQDASKYKIGVYEGGGYMSKGVFRPAYDCRMRTNENPEFCPVCQRAIRRIVEFYVP